MNSDVEYTATWVCDGISAASPMDAARKALKMHRNPTSIATVFKVSWQGTDGTAHSVEVDLTGDVGECPPDILTTPAPGEHLIPLTDRVPEHLERNRAIGCWIEGSRGIYANNYLLGVAGERMLPSATTLPMVPRKTRTPCGRSQMRSSSG